jgi:hypothetical protein
MMSLRRRLALWLCPELAAPQTATSEHLLWRGAQRPAWWRHTALRAFLTQAHRQMTIADAVAEARRRFGDAAPASSSVQRYWQRLDALQQGATPSPATPEETL